MRLMTVNSPPIRNDFRPRHHNHPADDQRHGKVPRHAKQRKGIHEIARGPKSTVGTRDGLRGFNVGDDQRTRSGQGSHNLSSE